MELLGDHPGIGELRLLAPALSALSAEQRWIGWGQPTAHSLRPGARSAGHRCRQGAAGASAQPS